MRIALAMAMAGARGPTQAELSKALQLPAAPQTASGIGYVVGAWDELDPEKIVLRVRNRGWVQSGYKLAEAYQRTLSDDFHSTIGVVDFMRDTNGARNAINQWVASATQNLIPSLLGPSQPKPDTKMALTNVVYFKGKWTVPFYATDTRDEPFFADGNKRVMARTMHQTYEQRAARVDGALVLERGYGGGNRIVMDIILPTRRDGIAAIEEAYVKGALPEWLKKLDTYVVDVALPKFETSSTLDLTWTLHGLGIVRATSKRDADFSGIDGQRNLFIGDVMQKAIVALDEEGARAAAATYVGGVPTVAVGPPKPPEKIVFHADHPFFFVIRDAAEDWTLFAGRVTDPTVK
jgi:serpin B